MIEVDPALVRANEVVTLGGDARRLRAALPGWAPRPFRETLAWMVAGEPGPAA